MGRKVKIKKRVEIKKKVKIKKKVNIKWKVENSQRFKKNVNVKAKAPGKGKGNRRPKTLYHGADGGRNLKERAAAATTSPRFCSMVRSTGGAGKNNDGQLKALYHGAGGGQNLKERTAADIQKAPGNVCHQELSPRAF